MLADTWDQGGMSSTRQRMQEHASPEIYYAQNSYTYFTALFLEVMCLFTFPRKKKMSCAITFVYQIVSNF